MSGFLTKWTTISSKLTDLLSPVEPASAASASRTQLADPAAREPTKLSKAGSVGFKGATSAKSPGIEAQQDLEELACASGVLDRASIHILDAEDHTSIGMGRPEIRPTLRAFGSDPSAAEAIRETTGLLATAYRRYSAIRRVGADQREDSGDAGLANSRVRSVHGVVP